MFPQPSWLKSLSAERCFLYIASFFGLIFLFLIPPFQVPDEPNHFYRAWQISEGNFFSEKKDQRVGGELPQDLRQFAGIFEPVIWYGYDYKVSRHQYSSAADMRPDDNRTFYDFNNTALYSPVCYAPAATGMFLARLSGGNYLTIFYSGRFFNLLFFILTSWLTIRFLPFMKWLFCFVMLLPMSLFINQSLSADSVTNSVCLLFAGLSTGLIYGSTRPGLRTKYFLVLIVILMACVKVVYTPLLLLLLLLPFSVFRSRTPHLLYMTFLAITAIFTALYWLDYTRELHLSYKEYNPAYRDKAALSDLADLAAQTDYVKKQGTGFLKILLNSFAYAAPDYLQGYIGVLGWHDLKLPPGMIIAAYAGIISFLLLGERRVTALQLSHRLFYLGLFLTIFVLVFVSQYLNWEMVGSDKMSIQGRYLIPFLPLLFFAFQGALDHKYRTLPFVMVLLSIILLSVTVYLIFCRYYPEKGFF